MLRRSRWPDLRRLVQQGPALVQQGSVVIQIGSVEIGISHQPVKIVKRHPKSSNVTVPKRDQPLLSHSRSRRLT